MSGVNDVICTKHDKPCVKINVCPECEKELQRPTEPKIEDSIKLLKNCSRYIEPIMTEGSCYKFHLFLKSIYPNAIPMVEDDHIASSIDGILYDINGVVEGGDYYTMDKQDIETAEGFSFDRNMLLSIKECPHCEEPILIDSICDEVEK